MTYLWLVLNLADLVLTLCIVGLGGIELMPVSGFLLAKSILIFAVVKLTGSLLALWWLVKHPESMKIAIGAMMAAVGINSLSLIFMAVWL